MLLSPALGRILFHQPHGLTLERRHRSIEGGGGGKETIPLCDIASTRC